MYQQKFHEIRTQKQLVPGRVLPRFNILLFPYSMANRDLDLHLITERIAAMSFPAEGLESAMRNHIEDIANILESRHPNHYMVFNLTERNYSVQKFVTGLCSQPGWSTQKPTAFKIVLETIHLCMDFLRRDAKNVIGKTLLEEKKSQKQCHSGPEN